MYPIHLYTYDNTLLAIDHGTVLDFSSVINQNPPSLPPQLVIKEELSASGESSVSLDVAATPTSSLKLNNNLLSEWDGFLDTVGKLVAGASASLQWLDFSFNDFKTIDTVSDRGKGKGL